MGIAGHLVFATVLIYGVLVSSSPLENKCRWDLASQCDTFSNAKDCQATGHCVQAVWEQRPVPVDVNPICKVCKTMIAKSRSLESLNRIEQLQLFKNSCERIPMENVQSECKTILGNSLPELYEVLSSQMSHEQICTVLELCNSNKMNKIMTQELQAAIEDSFVENELAMQGQSVDNPEQLSCNTCNLLSLQWKQKFESTSRGIMVEQLLGACYTLKSLSKPCVQVVVNNFNFTYDIIKEHLQLNTLCRAAGLCEHYDYTESELLSSVSLGEEFYCTECKKLVEKLRKSVVGNMTEDEVKKVLKSYCELAGDFQKDCETTVEEYSHEIFEVIQSDLDAQSICFYLGACSKKTEESVVNSIHTSQELQIVEYDNEPELPQCAVCRAAFKLAHNMAKGHFNRDKLKQTMNAACDHLGKLANKCHKFVNRHADRLIDFAKNPRIICTLLGQCLPFKPSSSEFQIVQAVNTNEKVHLTAKEDNQDPSKCLLCETVIKTVQKMSEKQENIRYALDQVCQALHTQPLRDSCVNIIGVHSELIVDLIKRNVSYQQICKALDMAQSNEETKVEPKEAHQTELAKNNPKCTLCTNVMKILVNHHLKNKDEIKRELNHVCHKMKALSHDCEKFVNKHADQIISLIAKHLSPKDICKALHVCRGSKAEDVLESPIMPHEQPDTLNGPFCLVCELVAGKFATLINNKHKRSHVVQEMRLTCNHLPMSIRDPCHRFVDQYGAGILDLLSKVTPSEVCHLAGVCLIKPEPTGQIPVKQNVNSYEDQLRSSYKNGFSQKVDQYSVKEMWIMVPKKEKICTLCEEVVDQLQTILDTKGKRKHLLDFIDNTCNFVPWPLSFACHMAVESYGLKLLELLSNISPQGVCQLLPFCSDQAEKTDTVAVAQLQCEPVCWTCKLVAGIFETFVNSEKRRERILEDLGLACDFMPFVSFICRTVLEEVGGELLYEASKITPVAACQAIYLCPDDLQINGNNELLQHDEQISVDETKAMWIMAPKKAKICTLCEAVVAQLVVILNTQEKREKLVEYIDNGCNFMPWALSFPCHMAIQSYGLNILDQLSQASPKEICQLLPWCTNKADHAEVIRAAQLRSNLTETFVLMSSKIMGVEVSKDELKGKPFCWLCEFVVQQFEGFIDTEKERENILNLILNACNWLPGFLGDTCRSGVESFGLDALLFILNASTKSCTFVTLC